MHLQLQTGYPQSVRLQGHYATDGEDAQLAVPACIVEFYCRRKRPESCMEAHKYSSVTSQGPPPKPNVECNSKEETMATSVIKGQLFM